MTYYISWHADRYERNKNIFKKYRMFENMEIVSVAFAIQWAAQVIVIVQSMSQICRSVVFLIAQFSPVDVVLK